MALHKKYERLLALDPDIAVIPECATPAILRKKAPGFGFDDADWIGEFPNKGLGVFTFRGSSLCRHASWENRYQHFLPVEVRAPIALNLLGVWAFGLRARVGPKPPTTRAAMEHYGSFLSSADAASLVAGDFNASTHWDNSGRYESFSALDAALGRLGLRSAYHSHSGEAFDQESAKTHFWQKNVQTGFHIDYVYAPTTLLRSIRNVEVGRAEDWLTTSDHAPLIVDLVLEGQHADSSRRAGGASPSTGPSGF